MRWAWLAVSTLSGTAGDLVSAKGMSAHGEVEHFGTQRVALLLRFILSHRLIVLGILYNAISFFSFAALLSIAEFSFAVPASALGYILRTALAPWYLREQVTSERWAGAILITAGVVLISF